MRHENSLFRLLAAFLLRTPRGLAAYDAEYLKTRAPRMLPHVRHRHVGPEERPAPWATTDPALTEEAPEASESLALPPMALGRDASRRIP